MSDEKRPTGLEILRQPFPEHQISLLPRPTKKDNPKGKCDICGGYHGLPAVHLKYVGHAALTNRLLDADSNWSWEPLSFKDGLPQFDQRGGLWIKLTVCGVTRLGYGNAEQNEYKEVGAREKEVIGDALRNAAMRFGAALELWHKGDLFSHDNDPVSDDHAPIDPKTSELVNHAPGAGNRQSEDLIKFGKFKGKKYEEVPLAELKSFCDWLKLDAAKKQQELSKYASEFVAKANLILNKNHSIGV